MKARPIRHFDLGGTIGEPSHVLALGGGRAVVVSRYRRKVVRIDGDTATPVDLEPLARTPRDGAVDLGRRGAPFRHGDGFAVAYADALHLWPVFDGPFETRPTLVPDAANRRERGRLEPLLACSAGERVALVALHAGAASVHEAHRIVRIAWSDPADSEARWDASDAYVDPRALPGLEASRAAASDPHPPAIQAIWFDEGQAIAHTTGASRHHARYGMECSAIVAIDATGATRHLATLPDGYATVSETGILLRGLRSKSGGIDFVALDLAGRPTGQLRVTKKAMAPVEDSWLVFGASGSDLWLGDGNGRIALLALAA